MSLSINKLKGPKKSTSAPKKEDSKKVKKEAAPEPAARKGSTSKAGETTETKPSEKVKKAASPSRVAGDRVETAAAGGVELLDVDPTETTSDPGASSEVTESQTEAATEATGGTEEPSEFDQLAKAQGADGEDSDLEPPEELVPGAEIPPVPELSGDPIHREENPLIGTQETFEVEGVEYERTTTPQGEVRTSYEIDGVDYTSTTKVDGSRSDFVAQSGEDGTHSRTVEHDPQGNLVQDQAISSQVETDPETGESLSTSRTETLTRDGTRTTTQEHRVDGTPRSYSSRIEDPEGVVREATLDLPENLDPEQFTEQLANFAENGDPELLTTAIGSIDSERLQGVAGAALTSDDGSDIYEFIKATSAASAAGGPGATGRLAGALHDALTDEALLDQHPPYDSFAVFSAFNEVGSTGGDVALGVELVDRLRVTSEEGGLQETLAQQALEGPGVAGGGTGVLGGVTSGLANRSNSFGEAADRVDELNRDLSYLTLNYAPFMSEDELAAAQQEFRDTHAEAYSEFEDLSSGIASNVDNIQRLEDMRAEYEEDSSRDNPFAGNTDLDTVSGNQLTRLRQASATQQGRAELATELQHAGRGRDSFLQDIDRLAGDSEGDAEQLQILRSNIFDTAISGSAGAAAVGDVGTSNELLEGLGVSDPNVTPDVIEALQELSNGAADLNDVHLQRLDDALDGIAGGEELSTDLRRAGSLLGLAGLTANGVDILNGGAAADTYIGALADGTELGTEVFEEALSRTFSQSGVQTAGRVAGGVGVLLSAVGTVQSLADGDVAGAGLNLAATVGGALTLSSSAAVTGVGAVITVAAIAGQIGLAQYRSVEASNHFESEDTERFVSHALGDANLSQEQEEAILHQLRNADSEGRLTGILFQQAAQQAGVNPRDFLTQIARLDSDAVHDIVTTGHGVDPGDGGVADLSEQDVAEFLEFVQTEYGVAV